MRGTLLLNATYEPLAVVPARRAVILVLAEKAEIVEPGDVEFRSQRLAFNCPKVIRLRYYVKVPYRAVRNLTRAALIARDNGKCGYCGAKATTIDHILPRSRGGKHAWTNTVACCSPCNSKKGDKLLSELGWTLQIKPFAPRGVRWVIIGVAELDPVWEPYLGAVTFTSSKHRAIAV